ncbi:Symplekin isoform A [Senna tora]|uniref:Symplekin isoform A n=1 Tax=Senna tora TaxID=362788 RepID=A0A834WSK0_9FABA|nr:Symplekin isoform A [Senna tora]
MRLESPPVEFGASVAFHAIPSSFETLEIPKATSPLILLLSKHYWHSSDMATASPRDQALSLLAAANNHGDLAVKISSLKQAKDVLLSMDPSLSSEIFPYLVDLQSSPECLVRKLLIEVIEEISLKAFGHSSTLMPVLLACLRDGDPIVVKQSIVSGTNLFRDALEEMTLQFQRYGKVERWLEEMWMWMLKFKDAVFGISLEPGSVGIKLLALKFLETFVLLFTSDVNDPEKSVIEGGKQAYNISWLMNGHPVLDPVVLMSEANRTFGILLNLLQSAGSLPGCLTITVVNCLAAIGRKRPQHYDTVLSALLNFEPSFQTVKGCHAPSIQYSLRTAFLGFLRCTYSPLLESRERLIRTLRAMNAGDAADQVIRQVDKMKKNGRDTRASKDDLPSSQPYLSWESSRKRSVPLDNDKLANGHGTITKRIRSGPDLHSPLPVQINDSGQDFNSVNGVSPNVPVVDSELTAAEQMIAMIGALLAEGERGAESLEILVSKIHPDLLADIVITNMKHLHKTCPPLTRLWKLPMTQQLGSQGSQTQVVASSGPTNSVASSTVTASAPISSATAVAPSLSQADISNISNVTSDSKRDPRKDPRRLDPRRVAVTAGGTAVSVIEDTGSMQPEFDDSVSLSKPVSDHVTTDDNAPAPVISKMSDDLQSEGLLGSEPDRLPHKGEVLEKPADIDCSLEVNASLDTSPSHADAVYEDLITVKLLDGTETNKADSSTFIESDQIYPDVSIASTSEDTSVELPPVPTFVELSKEKESNMRHLALKHIIESYKNLRGTDCQQICMPLLARLVAQIDDDEFIEILQKHSLEDHWQKGHEIVLHVLYHLHSLTVLDSAGSPSSTAAFYEKFLLRVTKSLLDSFPASDKSFSRLLGEVPLLPESALKVLNDLCYSDVIDHHGKIVRDIERVTQGLGAIWSLILGRPQNRQACLGIALKCAIHPQDEIRAKAIRLVANKLYQLSYISEDVEQFATKMLLAAVDDQISDTGLSQSGPTEQRSEVENQETTNTIQDSKPTMSEIDSARVVEPMSISEAQRLISLFFALCTKKPCLLQTVFDVYGRATRTVKQAFHRHIPTLIRALGKSSELLHIISDPPQGSENLLTLVLQILTQETTPSSDLIETVKCLYETKLRDVTILVPLLSSLSKNEVLPIFPRLVNLPLEKFQMALAHILQGSAHTGPALTPVEVLVAIHGIVPERDGLVIKKITDACSACFEQRTVFTQQVLAKALNQMVDQTPLPLLFMRTVIQAIDAFPALVDFVMEILSKLVTKQIWRMPKLWFGFLKCVYQTQPRSFHVLLQLPPPQLEGALNKYSNLRGPLASYANQPTVKSSLPRPNAYTSHPFSSVFEQSPMKLRSFQLQSTKEAEVRAGAPEPICSGSRTDAPGYKWESQQSTVSLAQNQTSR